MVLQDAHESASTIHMKWLDDSTWKKTSHFFSSLENAGFLLGL